MTFKGCKGAPCKCAAAGAACLCFATYVYPTAYGDECWHKPEVGLYCQSFLPEQPHSHSDQGRINFVRSHVTVAASTSSISAMLSPDWHIKPVG
jgi:hypothetical protein